MNALKIGGGVLAASLVVVGARQWMQAPDSSGAPRAVEPDGGELQGARAPAPAANDGAAERAVAPAEVPASASDDPRPAEEAAAIATRSAAEVCREAEAIALETLDKSVQVAQVYELALDALASGDPSGGEKQSDGSRVFDLVAGGELGTARLRVAPGDTDRFGAFNIRFDGPSTFGLPGDVSGASGSKLALSFGVGSGEVLTLGSWAEVQFASDPRGAPYAGEAVQIGAFLRVDGDEVNWRRQTLRPVVDEAGVSRGQMLFETPEAPFVGSLRDGRAQELAAALARFAPD